MRSLLRRTRSVAMVSLPVLLISSLVFPSTAMLASCPSGAIGDWPMEEGTGDSTADVTGGNDGAFENGPTWVAGGAPLAGGTQSISFDGSDDQIRVANSSDFDFGTTSFTVSLFAKSTTGERSVLGNYNGRGWGLYFYGDGRVNFFAYGDGGTNDNAFAGGILDGNWHHVAGVYKRSGASLTIDTYVDGTLIGSNTADVGDIASGSDLLFGRYLGQGYYPGSLDGVRVFNSELTSQQITDLAGGCTVPYCGDGTLDIGETCDDGGLNGTPNQCNLQCTGTTDPACGNGAVESGETCDDAALNGTPNQCNLTCDGTTASFCSNGVVESGEQCDDGNAVNDDACTNACAFPVCGNAVIEFNEQCDDGNTTIGDGCDDACQNEPVCGNSVVESGEQCDDGNTEIDDGCDASCQTEITTCGDGDVDSPEECDDGNAVNDDECTNACVLPVCGDTIVQEDEACDDGNTESNDGCSAICEDETIDTDGDGQTDIHEDACGSDPESADSFSPDNDHDNKPDCVDTDDDNDTVLDEVDNCALTANFTQADLDNDGIGDACDPQTCGNANIEGTEACDDGDQLGDDGCSEVCSVEAGWGCVHNPSICVLAPLCNGQSATIFVDSTPGSPTIFGGSKSGAAYLGILNGTARNDVMVGTEGKDRISGSLGDDLLCGRGNDDTLSGDNGNDTLFGENGKDKMSGSNGNDTMDGGEGDDNMGGSNGLDLLRGGPGNDKMGGGNDIDVLCGDGENDTLQGDIAADKLDGGAGTDSLKGGQATDICVNGESFSSCEDKVTPVVECSAV